jgi:hypothetical protein
MVREFLTVYQRVEELKLPKKTTKPKSKVNEAGNYTKPGMRKSLFNKIRAGSKGGDPGEWSARKAQLLAAEYKKAGGGYKN